MTKIRDFPNRSRNKPERKLPTGDCRIHRAEVSSQIPRANKKPGSSPGLLWISQDFLFDMTIFSGEAFVQFFLLVREGYQFAPDKGNRNFADANFQDVAFADEQGGVFTRFQ